MKRKPLAEQAYVRPEPEEKVREVIVPKEVIVTKEVAICPDRDQDQISDEVDRCPDAAGP